MFKSSRFMVFFCLVFLACTTSERSVWPYDVVVFGNTPSGVCAAVAASRRAAKTVLVSDSRHPVSMMPFGLGAVDHCLPELIGGIPREVFDSIAAFYRNSYGLESDQYKQCRGGLRSEPRVAEKVFAGLLRSSRVDLLLGWDLLDCRVENNSILAVSIRNTVDGSERVLKGQVYVDATCTGDLFAAAGCYYLQGREGAGVYEESLAGKIYQDNVTLKALPGSTGQGDSLIQAYSYRLCLTDSAENSVPLPEPSAYDRSAYLVLGRFIREKGARTVGDFLTFNPLPNRKFDIVNQGACWLSADLIGGSCFYPEATPEERAGIEKKHLDYLLGLLKFLRTDPEIPASLREEFKRYNPAADEFTDNGHLPYRMHVREARRLSGNYTFKEPDALTDTLKGDAIGLGTCPLESHAVRPWDYSRPRAEGWFFLPARPYQIPYGIMLPVWNRNLIVSVCVSASHVGYSTLGRDPASMVMGHAAGVAASISARVNCQPKEVPAKVLQEELLADKAILSLDQARPWGK